MVDMESRYVSRASHGLVCVASDGANYLLRAGDAYPASSPIVKEFPKMFVRTSTGGSVTDSSETRRVTRAFVDGRVD